SYASALSRVLNVVPTENGGSRYASAALFAGTCAPTSIASARARRTTGVAGGCGTCCGGGASDIAVIVRALAADDPRRTLPFVVGVPLSLLDLAFVAEGQAVGEALAA